MLRTAGTGWQAYGTMVMENREMNTVDIQEDHQTMNRIKQDIAPFAGKLELNANAAPPDL